MNQRIAIVLIGAIVVAAGCGGDTTTDATGSLLQVQGSRRPPRFRGRIRSGFVDLGVGRRRHRQLRAPHH